MPSAQSTSANVPAATGVQTDDSRPLASFRKRLTSPEPALDRALPHSIEAEMAVLGAMLLSPEASALACERLTEQHFFSAAHQLLFREIAAMRDALQAVDVVTLSQRLEDRQLLDQVGGAVYLADLIARVPTVANAEHYINIVWEKHLLRQLIATAQDVISRAYEQQDDVETWLDEVEQQIFQITAEKAAQGARPVKDYIKDAMASIERLYDQHGAVTGLPTGFRDYDRLTAGLHPGTVVVIAGRPSMGKTALAMNIAEHIAVDQHLPVGVFSLEMSAEELVKRLLCSRARVDLHKVRNGFLAERDFAPLTQAASDLMKAPLYIDDTAGLTVNQVRARARRMKQQFDVRLLVVDYLQLMRAPSRRAEASRQVEIADISAAMKALAKELNIPILLLSQLNRQPEQRAGGRPKMADLRESGAIEQDADVVGLLVRPEVYAEEEGEKEAERGKATLIIAKQRNGPTGDVPLTFLSEYTRFENLAAVSEEDVPELGRDDE